MYYRRPHLGNTMNKGMAMHASNTLSLAQPRMHSFEGCISPLGMAGQGNFRKNAKRNDLNRPTQAH